VTTANLFGPSVGLGHVHRWALLGTQAWIGEYVRESERSQGYEVGGVSLPLSWEITEALTKSPDRVTPCVVVQLPGIGDIRRSGDDGQHAGIVPVDLSAIIRARDEDDRDRVAYVYELALRLLFLERAAEFLDLPGWDGPDVLVESVAWAGSEIAPLRRSRTLVAATASFRVGMADLASDMAGPMVPRVDPVPDPGNWPDVETSTITVEHDPEALQ
jgi:hypothetical protein